MRTIAIINQKGGCGKTTVSINLAAVLASRGHKTLLVDVDPQSHCALGLAVPDSQIEKSIADLIEHGLDGALGFDDVVWQISRDLDLAPSNMSLAGIEQALASSPDKDRRLLQLLSTVQDRYEFCIIDCPPSIGLLTFNALRAAGEVLIPVETGYFAMQGSVKQEATIEMLARRVNHRVRFRVLPTMYDVRTKLAREILSELRRHFADKLLPVVIHFNSKLKEAASFGQPITEYDPASRGMADFEKLADWLMANPLVPLSSEATLATDGSGNPAINRAAELVERARALSARTAALSARIKDQASATLRNDPIDPPKNITAPTAPLTSAAHAISPQSPMHTTSTHLTTKSPSRLSEQLARIYGVRKTTQGLLFVQPANGKELQIYVAGDFNKWSPSATPLQRDENLGVYQTCITVPPGRYRYRLIVNGQWVKDPYNNYVESNPFGELNSIIEVDDK